MTPRNEWRYNFTGWLLFNVSAGDRVYIIASLFFLIACLVFLVPVWRLRPPRD